MEKKKRTLRFRNSFTVSVKMSYEFLDDACISKKGRCTDDIVCSASTALTPYLCFQAGFGLDDNVYEHDSFDLLVPEEAYQIVYEGLNSICERLRALRDGVTDDELLRRDQVARYSSFLEEGE